MSNVKNQSSNKPTHIAYQVEQYTSNGEEKSNWTEIGSAWAHKDGNGLNLNLKAFPVDGKITIRVPKDETQESDSLKS